MLKSLQEFTEFFWWISNSAKWLPTFSQSQLTWAMSPPVSCYCLQPSLASSWPTQCPYRKWKQWNCETFSETWHLITTCYLLVLIATHPQYVKLKREHREVSVMSSSHYGVFLLTTSHSPSQMLWFWPNDHLLSCSYTQTGPLPFHNQRHNIPFCSQSVPHHNICNLLSERAIDTISSQKPRLVE